MGVGMSQGAEVLREEPRGDAHGPEGAAIGDTESPGLALYLTGLVAQGPACVQV